MKRIFDESDIHFLVQETGRCMARQTEDLTAAKKLIKDAEKMMDAVQNRQEYLEHLRQELDRLRKELSPLRSSIGNGAEPGCGVIVNPGTDAGLRDQVKGPSV